uniref:Uncharacterized protein n=1 Tax=Arundo donax TaxID=35708 RepID=A0A0A9EU72_ARUDO
MEASTICNGVYKMKLIHPVIIFHWNTYSLYLCFLSCALPSSTQVSSIPCIVTTDQVLHRMHQAQMTSQRYHCTLQG